MRYVVALLTIACCLPAVGRSAAAPDGEVSKTSWQAAAKGLTHGPLCSLVLRVRIADRLELVASGGCLHGGWNTLEAAEIPLGTIGPAGGTKITEIERSGDWSMSKAAASFGPEGRMTVYASQLSPGIVIETTTTGLVLFGGQHEHTATVAEGKLTVHGRIGGKPLPTGTVTPGLVAVPDGDGIKVTAATASLPVPPAEKAWMAVWWGGQSHFARTDCPIAGEGLLQDAYLGDFPLLLAFSEPPLRISVAEGGGLALTFPAGGKRLIRVAVLPLLESLMARAERTQSWAGGLPEPIARRCRIVADYTRHYPLSAREDFQYDAAQNEATFTETVSFLEISKGGCRSAPLPPIAALAMEQGSFVKMKTSSPLEPVQFSTPLGPLLRAENTETFTWSIQGLRELVEPPAADTGRGKAPAELVAELDAQVDKMLAAGVLGPWVYADNVPINASRGEYYWGEPGEILALLAPLHGVLDEKRQAGLVRYMTEVRQTWPPETTAWIPPDEGTRRGGYDLGPCQLAERVAKERSRRVSPYALYGLERFYAAAGGKPDAQTWQACRELLDAAFEEQAWATLYLLGHPNRVLPWKKRSGIDPARLAEWDESPDWRGDRPGAVVNANRLFAAGVGAVRLARLMNDPAAEQKAWWLLARAAVLRLAMGKYAAWQYKAGLVTIPPEKDWYWKYSQHFPRSWGGYLETDDWSRPEHDVRQVVELAPDGVELQDWAGTVGDAWTQRTTAQLVAFRYMTPELARLLADHLRSEAAVLVERIAWNQPLWYASFGEAILGWEHNMNHPSDAYQVFMARSRLLSPSPEQLTRWIDVPWLDRGDLFYLNKLAEAIRTYRSGKGS